MSADVFSIAQQIRFSHTDPAGIVYFPNYFDFANGVVEDFYTKRLAVDYAQLLFAQRKATPIVHAACDFFAPSRMGETLTLTLMLERVGQSSIAFSIFGHADAQLRLLLRIVTVYMDLDSGKSTPIPDDLRARLAAYRLAAEGWTPPPKPGAVP